MNSESFILSSREARVPLCSSIRTKPGAKEPDVWVRIVHLSIHGTKAPATVEQQAEVRLGPRRVFDHGSAGHPVRLVPVNRSVAERRNPTTNPVR